jgi:hypothetical protein
MNQKAINLLSKFSKFTDQWSPKIIAQMNDYHLKIAKVEGEIYIVPKDVEHKPFATKECKILLIEPAGTVNTGDAGGNQTVSPNNWI